MKQLNINPVQLEKAKTLANVTQERVNEMVVWSHRTISKAIATIAREKATPPIKGDITIGKLRWRGITLEQCTGIAFGRIDAIYVRQRGKILGKVVLKYSKEEISVITKFAAPGCHEDIVRKTQMLRYD